MDERSLPAPLQVRWSSFRSVTCKIVAEPRAARVLAARMFCDNVMRHRISARNMGQRKVRCMLLPMLCTAGGQALQQGSREAMEPDHTDFR